MTRATDIAKVSAALRAALGKFRKPAHTRFHLKFDAPPYATTTLFGGVPLSRLMTPDLSGVSTSTLSDLWQRFCFHKDNPDEMEEDEVWDTSVPQTLRRFVDGNATLLLLAIGNHPKHTRQMHGGTLLVGRPGAEFGILDNEPMPVDQEILHGPRVFRCWDRPAAVMLKQAEKVGNADAHEAIRALRSSMANGIATELLWAGSDVFLDFDKAKKAVYGSDDPIADLYMEMVPDLISKNKFNRLIWPSDKRKLNPSEKFRDKIFARLQTNGLI